MVDEVLDDHASEQGHELIAYRNHVYRVVNLCLAIVGDCRVELEKIVIAAVFHDLGIWTNNTFDYLAPSVAIAREHLAARGMADWMPEIEAMILDRWSNHFGAQIGSTCRSDYEGSDCRARSSRLSSPRGRARAFIDGSFS
jgi:predicted metal-dependent HD superfamily phosphohydrolase